MPSPKHSTSVIGKTALLGKMFCAACSLLFGLTLSGADINWNLGKQGQLKLTTENQNDTYIVSGSVTAEINTVSESKYIVVESGSHTLVLNGLTAGVNTAGNRMPNLYAPLSVRSGAVLNLKFKGKNALKAGRGKAGIGVEAGATIIINGEPGATLSSEGSAGGAGIGGNAFEDAGNITIQSGEITAKGNSGFTSNSYWSQSTYESAGIGSGSEVFGDLTQGGNVEKITISGGNITTAGANYTPGIGGGNAEIQITGGVIKSSGGSYAAAVGGGYRGKSTNAANIHPLKSIALSNVYLNCSFGSSMSSIGSNKSCTAPISIDSDCFIEGFNILSAYSLDKSITLTKSGTSAMTGNVSINKNFTFPGGSDASTLTVPAGQILSVDAGTILTLGGTGSTATGTLNIAGTLEVYGKIVNVSGKGMILNTGTINIYNEIENNNIIYNKGILNGSEKITGTGVSADANIVDGNITLEDSCGDACPGHTVISTSAAALSNTIKVNGGKHKLILGAMSLAPSASPALNLESGAEVELKAAGVLSLKGASGYAGIRVPDGAILTLDAPFAVTATGQTTGAGIGGNNGENAGKFILNNGSVTAAAAASGAPGASVGGGANGNGGEVIINGGTLTCSGGLNGKPNLGAGTDGVNQGSISLGGKQANLNARTALPIVIPGGSSLAGTLELLPGASLENNGNLTVSTLTIPENLTVINKGSMSPSTLNLSGTLENQGSVKLSALTQTLTGKIVNDSVLTLGGTTTWLGSVVNTGTLTNNTSFTLSGNLENSGLFINNASKTITVSASGKITNTVPGEIRNLGTILNNGTFENGLNTLLYIGSTGTFTNNNIFSNAGTLENQGVFNNTQTFTNSGYVANFKTLNNTGTVDNTGTVKNKSDGTVSGDGTWNGNTPAGQFKGSGTKGDPYLLSNADELLELLHTVNASASATPAFSKKYFALTADITLDSKHPLPRPVGISKDYSDNTAAFGGHLYGFSHTITVECPEGGSYGLFSAVNGPGIYLNINDLTLKFDGDVLGAPLTMRSYAGKFTNISIQAKNILPLEDDESSIAYGCGMFGRISGSSVTNCTVNVEKVGSEAFLEKTATLAGLGAVAYFSNLENVEVNIADRIVGYSNNSSIEAAGLVGTLTPSSPVRTLKELRVNIGAKTGGGIDVSASGARVGGFIFRAEGGGSGILHTIDSTVLKIAGNIQGKASNYECYVGGFLCDPCLFYPSTTRMICRNADVSIGGNIVADMSDAADAAQMTAGGFSALMPQAISGYAPAAVELDSVHLVIGGDVIARGKKVSSLTASGVVGSSQGMSSVTADIRNIIAESSDGSNVLLGAVAAGKLSNASNVSLRVGTLSASGAKVTDVVLNGMAGELSAISDLNIAIDSMIASSDTGTVKLNGGAMSAGGVANTAVRIRGNMTARSGGQAELNGFADKLSGEDLKNIGLSVFGKMVLSGSNDNLVLNSFANVCTANVKQALVYIAGDLCLEQTGSGSARANLFADRLENRELSESAAFLGGAVYGSNMPLSWVTNASKAQVNSCSWVLSPVIPGGKLEASRYENFIGTGDYTAENNTVVKADFQTRTVRPLSRIDGIWSIGAPLNTLTLNKDYALYGEPSDTPLTNAAYIAHDGGVSLGHFGNGSFSTPDQYRTVSAGNNSIPVALTAFNGEVPYVYDMWPLTPKAYDANLVIFHSNGATSGSMDSAPFIGGIEFSLPSNTFVRKGYIFEGWNTRPDSTGKGYANGSTVTFDGGSAVELYATWKGAQSSYTVFHLKENPDNGSYKVVDTDMFLGESGQLPIVVSKGYPFFTLADTTFETASTAETRTVLPIAGDNSLVICCYYARDRFTLAYLTNGGTGKETADSLRWGASFATKSTYTFSRTGYKLASWNTQADASGTSYKTSDMYIMPQSDLTLHAVWEAQSYTVKFHSNGGSGSSYTQDFVYGQAANLNPNTFTKTDYRFSGWNTQADGSGTPYEDGAPFTISDQNVNLYAQWEAGLTVSPSGIVSYLAGRNLGKTPFPSPVLSYSLDGSAQTDTDVRTYTYYVDGKLFEPQNFTDTFPSGLPFTVVYELDGKPVTDTFVNTYGLYTQKISTKGYAVSLSSGAGSTMYRIHGVESILNILPVSETENIPYTPVSSDTPVVQVTAATPVMPADASYVNSAGLPVTDTRAIVLMEDQIIAADHADEIVGTVKSCAETAGMSFDMRYLTLLDSSNGNIEVKTDSSVTVYLPYPQGTDSTVQFKVLHFHEASRADTQFKGNFELLPAQATNEGIVVQTRGFSPFVLAYPSAWTVNPIVYEGTYNGQIHTPETIVKDGYTGNLLVKDSDYIFEYADALHAGTASVIVKGIDVYAGLSQTFTFTILPAHLKLTVPDETVAGKTNYVSRTVDTPSGLGSDIIRYATTAVNYTPETLPGIYAGVIDALVDWSRSSAQASDYRLTVQRGTLTVSSFAQRIEAMPLGTKTFGDMPFQWVATATSGRAVTFESLNPSVAAITPDGLVTLQGAGVAGLTARQTGDSIWNAADPVTLYLTVNKGDPQFRFGTLSKLVKGQTVQLQAFSDALPPSKGLVTYSVSDPSKAAVSGNQLKVLSDYGSVTIYAQIAEEMNYRTASAVLADIPLVSADAEKYRIAFAESGPLSVEADMNARQVPLRVTLRSANGIPLAGASMGIRLSGEGVWAERDVQNIVFDGQSETASAEIILNYAPDYPRERLFTLTLEPAGNYTVRDSVYSVSGVLRLSGNAPLYPNGFTQTKSVANGLSSVGIGVYNAETQPVRMVFMPKPGKGTFTFDGNELAPCPKGYYSVTLQPGYSQIFYTPEWTGETSQKVVHENIRICQMSLDSENIKVENAKHRIAVINLNPPVQAAAFALLDDGTRPLTARLNIAVLAEGTHLSVLLDTAGTLNFIKSALGSTITQDSGMLLYQMTTAISDSIIAQGVADSFTCYVADGASGMTTVPVRVIAGRAYARGVSSLFTEKYAQEAVNMSGKVRLRGEYIKPYQTLKAGKTAKLSRLGIKTVSSGNGSVIGISTAKSPLVNRKALKAALKTGFISDILSADSTQSIQQKTLGIAVLAKGNSSENFVPAGCFVKVPPQINSILELRLPKGFVTPALPPEWNTAPMASVVKGLYVEGSWFGNKVRAKLQYSSNGIMRTRTLRKVFFKNGQTGITSNGVQIPLPSAAEPGLNGRAVFLIPAKLPDADNGRYDLILDSGDAVTAESRLPLL